jgi:hypothetical protein
MQPLRPQLDVVAVAAAYRHHDLIAVPARCGGLGRRVHGDALVGEHRLDHRRRFRLLERGQPLQRLHDRHPGAQTGEFRGQPWPGTAGSRSR